MLVDYHTHTDLSDDGSGSVEEYCEWAVKNGIKELCFTNHQEWLYVVEETYRYAMSPEEIKNLFVEVKVAKKKYPELVLKVGCELGYYPNHLPEIKAFAEKFPWDYVLGSAHRIAGELVGITPIPGINNKRVRRKWYRAYFRVVEEMTRESYFDCVGHMNLIARFHPQLEVSEYADLIETVITNMKKNDLGFELNTSGWTYPNKMCYPHPDITRMLFDRGIRKVTIGSDMHNPERVGENVKKGMQLLKKIGFKEFCTFEKRKAAYHPL